MAGREELSSAVGAPKSAANISLVRLADLCTRSDGVGSIVVVMVGCVKGDLSRIEVQLSCRIELRSFFPTFHHLNYPERGPHLASNNSFDFTISM